MMPPAHPPGHLAYGALTLGLKKLRPCPRCKGDVRERIANELCSACRTDPARVEAMRRKKNAMDRRRRQRIKEGLPGVVGRPRKQGGIWNA